MMTHLVISKLLFYLFSLITVIFALFAVSSVRILRAAVALMSLLISTAALYALSGSYFMTGIQLLVYVGGIVVLLVFAVMLTQTNELVESSPSVTRKFFGFVSALLFAVVSLKVLGEQTFNTVKSDFIIASDAAELGRSFLNYGEGGYALPFELISLLLLAAIIGGIVIAQKVNPEKELK